MRYIPACLAVLLAACSSDSPADGERSAPTFDAIAADQTVRFTGTEPFWGGEVKRESLTYSTPENIDGEAIGVSRFAGLNGVSWSGRLDGQAFDLSLTEGECSDGMSDRTYPYTVTLSVRGETRRGCAWTEDTPYTEPGPERGAHERGGRDSAHGDRTAPAIVARDLVLDEWRKAENRARCAPLSFTATASGEATPRRANFSGGWAVAFDLPERRSAFGVAGTGQLDRDHLSARRARLETQWPYMRDLDALPDPSFAGYGIAGGDSYPEDNREGIDRKSLAYVRVAGQDCLYNVWSDISRAHLEALLESLRLVPTPS